MCGYAKELSKQYNANYRIKNREYFASYAKRTYHETRLKLMQLLGDCCKWCGHPDERVLEFDHINDDGADDRKKFSGARSMLDYYVKNHEEAKERLQLLCRNCNWLKRKGFQDHFSSQL
jgi:hypothetical protein